MVRACGSDSILVLLHGAAGVGIFEPATEPPVPQPLSDRVLGMPQVVGFRADTQDVTALPLVQVVGFQVQQSGFLGIYFTLAADPNDQP